MYSVQKKQALYFYIHYFKTTEMNLLPQMSNCQESKYCKTGSISTFAAQIFLFGLNFEPKVASTGWAGCAGEQESVTASLLDQRQKTAFGIWIIDPRIDCVGTRQWWGGTWVHIRVKSALTSSTV